MNPSIHASHVTIRLPSTAPVATGDAQLLIGPSPAMATLWSQLRVLAPHFRAVLLRGEDTCATEAIARALHDLSSLAGTPLIPIRADEAESQLRRLRAVISNVAGGTIFLSDVDRLSLLGQQMVLRVLKSRRHRRIAVIASTSGDLRTVVAAGAFDAELFASLNSFQLQIPSLRERVQDMPLLTHEFFKAESARANRPIPSLDSSFLAATSDYSWPGNFDQLRSTISWMIRHVTGPLGAANLHVALAEARPKTASRGVRMVRLDHVVQEHVQAVLIGCNGNKLRAAEVLGISRSTLYRMLDAASAAAGGGSD